MSIMGISPEEFVKRLHDISESDSRPYGRLRLIAEEEQKYNFKVLQYEGHFALSNAFKCFFLETVELVGSHCRPRVTAPVPEFYGFFVPRMVHAFHSLCGTERVAISGYPLLAYTVLRNVFDNLILASASLQEFADFYRVEGIERGKPLDIKAIKTLRKRTEHDVRLKMMGKERGGSGNSDSVISGRLASPKPPSGGEPKERGNETHETESRSDL